VVHDVSTGPGQSGARLRYDPALDGTRAVGVGLVLLFHGGVSWATGGFLGVSVFFTLSGFLITSLLLADQATTGGVGLRRFWVRRLRRLMPAALACLALILVLTATVLTTAKDTLRGDVLAALADVANWRFYFSGQSYANLFAVPSPVQHYWSLAIEEQFYLVFPLLVWLILVRLKWSRGVLAGVLGAGFVGATAASVALGAANADLVYYATFTRAAELLSGCLLAMVVSRWGRSDPAEHRAWWAVIGGPLVLAGLVVIIARTAQGDEWLYEGGLAAFSLLSVALIATARRPGPLRWLLSLKPFVWLGLISYGVYLYHWPLFLWLTADRTGLDGVWLQLLRWAVTLAVSAVSYRFLEEPIRRGRALTGWRGALAPPIAFACLLAAAVPLAAGGASATAVFADNGTHSTLPPLPSTTVAAATVPTTAASTPASTATAPPTTAPAGPASSAAPITTVPPPTTTTAPPPAARVVVFGDSTAKADAAGLLAWGQATGQAQVSDAGTIAGCGLLRTAKRTFGNARQTNPDGCKWWDWRWPQILAENPADVAVLINGPWEVVDQQIKAGDSFRSLGDPVFDQFAHDELLAATDVLLAHVPNVVWFTNPHTHPAWGAAETADQDAADAAKMDRLNDIIRQVAAERPQVVLVDLEAHLMSIPGADRDQAMRPDGVHFSPDAATEMAGWFGPLVVAAGRR
jgi:peptidoglycan/LPS O-acetylase OafA/YrhL